MSALGTYIKEKRQLLNEQHRHFSIRALARRIGIHQSYLSKLERGERAPLTDDRIHALARELGESHELLNALSGKLPERVTQLIRRNPQKFLNFLVDLECNADADQCENTYVRDLEQRKKELETLTRMLRDEINAKIKLQQELSTAEFEKLTILANLKDVLVAYIDRDFNIIWTNAPSMHDINTLLNTSTGEKCHQLIEKSDTPCNGCTAQFAIMTGIAQDGTRTSSDGRQWITRSVPIKNVQGEVEKIVHLGFDVTELVQTKNSLLESERRWRFALEGAQEGVWDWNSQTDKVFYSHRWKEMLGFMDHEIGDDLSEWDSRIHPDDRHAVYEALNKHMQGETDYYEIEYRLKCKDDSYKWILDRGIVVERDVKNKPIRAIGTHFDISEKKKSADIIKNNEEFLDALINSIQDGITVLSNDLTIEYVNPTQRERYPHFDNLVGKKCYEVFHGQNIPCNKCPSLDCIKSKSIQSKIVEIDSRYGKKIYELFCYPIIDRENDCVKGTVEFVRDITKKTNIERSLHFQESRFRAVFENSPAVQIMINADNGSIIDCNMAAEKFYRFKKYDFCSKTIFQISTTNKEELIFTMRSCKREGNKILQARHRLSDGTTREVEVITVFIAHGEIPLLHCIIIDVTERNQALRDLAHKHNQLESIIESIPDVVCLKDANDRWLALNKPGRTLMGLESADFVNKNLEMIKALLPVKYHDATNICRLYGSSPWNQNQMGRFEITILASNQKRHTFDVLTVPVFHVDGTIKGRTVIARDITEIRGSEVRQAFLAAIIDNSPNICVIKDLELRVIATNQAFALAAGKDISELIGKTDAEIFGVNPDTHPIKGYMDDEREVQEYEVGRVLERQEDVIYPDGKVHVVLTRKFPIFGNDGTLIATANISTDLTEKINSIEKHRQIENQCLQIVQEAPVGVYSATPDGIYININETHARMYGFESPEDMKAHLCNSREAFFDQSDRNKLLSMLERLDVVSNFECRIRRKDGSPLWTARSIRAMRDAQGKITHYHAFVENIQSRKEAELASANARRILLGVLEQLEAGVYVITPHDKKIVYANSYLTMAIGRELVGRSAPDILLKNPEHCGFLSNDHNSKKWETPSPRNSNSLTNIGIIAQARSLRG